MHEWHEIIKLSLINILTVHTSYQLSTNLLLKTVQFVFWSWNVLINGMKTKALLDFSTVPKRPTIYWSYTEDCAVCIMILDCTKKWNFPSLWAQLNFFWLTALWISLKSGVKSSKILSTNFPQKFAKLKRWCKNIKKLKYYENNILK